MFVWCFRVPRTANKTVEATAGKFLVEVGVLRAVPHLYVSEIKKYVRMTRSAFLAPAGKIFSGQFAADFRNARWTVIAETSHALSYPSAE